MARIHITIEKSLNDHGNDGVGTHLEQDILEWSQVGLSKAYYKHS